MVMDRERRAGASAFTAEHARKMLTSKLSTMSASVSAEVEQKRNRKETEKVRQSSALTESPPLLKKKLQLLLPAF